VENQMTVFRRMAGLLTVAIVISVGAAACAKKPALPAPAPPPPPPAAPAAPPAPPPPPAPPAAPAPAPLSEEEIFRKTPLSELQKNLSDVFFELDESSISDQARAVLQKNAEWMKRWPSTKITIEGHCDERGSAEYNLALGDRRAAAVRDYLASLGVGPDRMTVVSKGKEQPVCTEDTESCWRQNRRGHSVLTDR
jgi:peptidoglycan-associated lipoprotein